MSAIVHGVSGVIGGSAAMVVTYPFLTVTTRQQVKTEEDKGPLKTLWEIISKEGINSLYSGIGPAVFGVSVSMGVYFYSYEKIKQNCEKLLGRSLNPFENLLVGYIAGAINSTITCPIWRVTTRMQARKGSKSQSPYLVCRAIYSESGIQGFWKGLRASLILCINPAIQWMVYEQLAKIILKKKKTLSSLEIFILGAIGKIVATLVTYPYIIVKSRMQAETTVTKQNGPKRVGLKEEAQLQFRYNGLIDAFKKIITKEGFKGLYSGLQSKLLQSVLNASFMFLFKERSLQLSIAILKLFLKK